MKISEKQLPRKANFSPFLLKIVWKALDSPKLSKILSSKEYGRVRIKNDLQRQSFTKYLRLTHDNLLTSIFQEIFVLLTKISFRQGDCRLG